MVVMVGLEKFANIKKNANNFILLFLLPFMPILQTALDLMNLERALQIAKETVLGETDWLEVGTPLIKSEGMNSIRKLRKLFPNKTIVADLKTIDTGGFETELAAKSGANIVIILGVSDDETIKDAVRSGQKYGCKIMVDLLGVEDKVKRAKELVELGIDYLCIHVGIDQQMIGKNPLAELKKIVKEVNIPIAVAGGINSENAYEFVKEGAEIIIVGGAITKAENIVNATKIMKKAIEKKIKIKTELHKKYSDKNLFKAFSLVSTPNITDAMHRKGAMVGILPLKDGYKMVGKAFTVKTVDGDWAKPVEAIEKAKKGDVIVIDANGGNIAIWGELATRSAKNKGLSGVVIDGSVRDVEDIKKINFPVFSKNISPNAGEPKGFGELNAEIICGGQLVRDGDWLIGDDNGVVVVPKERAVEIANRSLDIKEKENRIREEIRRGSVLSVVMELEKWEKVG